MNNSAFSPYVDFSAKQINQLKFQFSVSTQDGIIALRKAHTCCNSSLSGLPQLALETLSWLIQLNIHHSRPLGVDFSHFLSPSLFP